MAPTKTKAAEPSEPKPVALNLRKFDPAVKDRAKHLAGARGLMLPAYFERLVAMHEALLAKSAAGDKHSTARLREVGLDPVTR